MAVNFTKNQDDLTKAWRKVVDSKDSQQWALFGYEGNTNVIKLMSTGSNGLKELVTELNCSLIQYAFCRVLHDEYNINKLILINWQGDSSPLSRKGLCASHVGDIANYFKGCAQTITIRNDDEATEEYLMEQIIKTSHSRIRSMSRLSNASSATNDSKSQQNENEIVGSTYKKTDISSDITIDRKSFWQRQEEEEKERLLEEKKRSAERQAQFERERKSREESEARKLAETIRERDRLIEATRKAERHDSPSSASQPSSMMSNSASGPGADDDDDRVGRRSEFIRLERNQETHSLISKGLIKNKRAIFEQAASLSQNHQAPPTQSNLIRRASGAMITQRMNSLRSFENTSTNPVNTNTNITTASSNINKNIENLSNGVTEKVKITSTGGDCLESKGVVKKEVETIKITNNEVELPKSTFVAQNETSIVTNNDKQIEKSNSKVNHTNDSVTEKVITVNNNFIKNKNNETAESKENPLISGTTNKNSKNESNLIQKEAECDEAANEVTNGGYSTKAKALYDYQASDKTEISFDPDDIIGYIEKVDPGWWHGTVITGAFKGQIGLFPSNYVEEL